MNYQFILSIAFLIFGSGLSYSQNFVDEEIDNLAEDIAQKLDAKNAIAKKRKKIENVVVESFTDTEGNVSKLGASLAEEFTLALSIASISFSVISINDLEKQNADRRGGLNIGGIISDGVEVVGDIVTDDADYEANRRNNEVSRSVSGIFNMEDNIRRNKNKYRNVDAVVTGTLTESNDQYRILIKVIVPKDDFAVRTSARGYLTKTPFILSMEREENNRISLENGALNDSGGGGNSSYSSTRSSQTFESNNVRVELLGAVQNGQTIDCNIRLTNVGPDAEVYLYGSGSRGKLIDANNSYDYLATQVKFGELVNNSEVRKTLVTNNSTTAKITYGGVSRDVSKIAKMTIRCYSTNGGYFWIEFRDVIVR